MKSRSQHQSDRAAAQVAKETRGTFSGTRDEALRSVETQQLRVRAKETHANSDDLVRAEETRDPDALAAELFDHALKDARLTSDEVAYLLGVSVSLVNRMRNVNARERVSFGQMLRLPPAFWIALNKELNQEYDFAGAALRRLLSAAGDLAVLVR